MVKWGAKADPDGLATTNRLPSESGHGPPGPILPSPHCPARGQTAQGNIKAHSYPQRRYRCTICRKAFAATTGTPLYRLHQDPALFVRVVTPLAYGRPTQAIVAAFGLDEPTVAPWQDEAGAQAQD